MWSNTTGTGRTTIVGASAAIIGSSVLIWMCQFSGFELRHDVEDLLPGFFGIADVERREIQPDADKSRRIQPP